MSADDPEYAGLLAGLLSESGQIEAAREWRARAAERYTDLMRRHPAAFADHAAEFWLGCRRRRAESASAGPAKSRDPPDAARLYFAPARRPGQHGQDDKVTR